MINIDLNLEMLLDLCEKYGVEINVNKHDTLMLQKENEILEEFLQRDKYIQELTVSHHLMGAALNSLYQRLRLSQLVDESAQCTSSGEYYNRNYKIDIVDEFKSLGEENSSDSDNYDLDVSKLKKQIKYSRNPMEKKRLEKELNALYKRRKKWRC